MFGWKRKRKADFGALQAQVDYLSRENLALRNYLYTLQYAIEKVNTIGMNCPEYTHATEQLQALITGLRYLKPETSAEVMFGIDQVMGMSAVDYAQVAQQTNVAIERFLTITKPE